MPVSAATDRTDSGGGRRPIRRSVLNLAVVPDGSSSAAAAADTTVLARRADDLGFDRFWVAEHHNMPTIASTSLANGVLAHYPDPVTGDADLTVTLTKPQLLVMLAGAGRDGVEHAGDLSAIQRLLSILDTPDVSFAIVTP